MQEPTAESAHFQKFKKAVKESFGFFDKVGNDTVPQDDVGTIMRYLGQFPSESDLKDSIIPEMLDFDPRSDGAVSYKAFESVFMRCYKDKEHDPADSETLLACFRVLDQEKRGFIHSDVLHEHLSTTRGKAADGFRERDMSDFLEYAKDKESADSSRIYYEDYVAKLTSDVERHIENLYGDRSGKA
eukprot:TRINITY_DN35315_c0_g1_i1.p1 TRINITY_DN35315_c0_g1~~TRINITY_DN35315_c0_g1_i1.p1  ORF type:complete len:186 (-),score=46.88 TRINITY_DN35315_c0_g1_i1:74-631(-)